MAPKIVFITDQSFWPEEIGLAEKFTAKWVLQNQGDAGEAFLGLTYKGTFYIILVNGQRTSHIDANTQAELTCETSIKDSSSWMGEFKENTTIEIIFQAGYYDASAKQYPITDTWPCRTYVKVGGGLPVPTWILVGAGGLLLVGTLGIVLSRRKK